MAIAFNSFVVHVSTSLSFSPQYRSVVAKLFNSRRNSCEYYYRRLIGRFRLRSLCFAWLWFGFETIHSKVLFVYLFILFSLRIFDRMSHSQSFEEIKTSCVRSGRLYEDPDFEAIDDNVFTSRRPPRPFVWRRPTVGEPLSYNILSSARDGFSLSSVNACDEAIEDELHGSFW